MGETRSNETQEVGGEEGKKIKWTTIKIPSELRDQINDLATMLDKPAWKLVLDAVSFFDEQIHKPRLKESLPLVDKVSWYIVKLSTSVAEFKINPTEENFNKLMKTVEQVKERLGVDVDMLVRACEVYKKEPSVDNKMEINAALKIVVFELITEKLLALNQTN